MKLIPTGTAVVGLLALAGSLGGAVAAGGWGWLERLAADPAARQTRPAPIGGSCGPGPVRVTDMEYTEGGYLKTRRWSDYEHREFYFTRAMYNDVRYGNVLGDGGPAWSIDYPNADRIMMEVATRLSSVDACEWEHLVSLADPELRRYPFLYSLEWGYANLTEAEVLGLRGYLEAGGFLMLDDFWGTAEWANFEYQMRRVLPDRFIEDVPRDHVLFRSYYHMDGEILQIPNVGNGRAVGRGLPGARTSERDGEVAHLRGIFDDRGRLMVAINWNTDLGDALEWAEDPTYPLEFSSFASKLFLNHIIYALSH
jgi:hypothetical protein